MVFFIELHHFLSVLERELSRLRNIKHRNSLRDRCGPATILSSSENASDQMSYIGMCNPVIDSFPF